MKNQFQLEKEDIDNLFIWVRKKSVPYKDVQFEIVDHLASGMEDLMTEDPSMSKTKALFQIYQQFPITGFTNLIAEKRKSLKKYWKKKFLDYLLEYLKLPKIIILILMFTFCLNGIFAFVNYSISTNQMYMCAIFFCIIFAIRTFFLEKEFKREGKFLVLDSYFEASSATMTAPHLIFIINAGLHNSNQYDLSGWFGITLSAFFSVWVVILYANSFIFPKMLVKEIQSKYSHLSQEMMSGQKLSRI